MHLNAAAISNAIVVLSTSPLPSRLFLPKLQL
jgi:hypothetical protein